jgi:transposase InsO family protein
VVEEIETAAGTAPAVSPNAVVESNVTANAATTSDEPGSSEGVAESGATLQRFRAALRRGAQEHLERLEELYRLQAERPSRARRRGRAWQPKRRDLERRIRHEAVQFYRQVQAEGGSLTEAAQALGVEARTLRHWAGRVRVGKLTAKALGRPLAHTAPAQRNRVIGYLAGEGPGVGLPTLQRQFPEFCRAELADVQQRFRRLLRQRTRRLHYVLHWQKPARVWAIDFAEPSLPGAAWSLPPIDGRYPYLAAVRDLASGYQLGWLPVSAASAAVAMEVLGRLFACWGAPLLLKCDNGPCFRAEAFKEFLERTGVLALFSPPHCPRYNGAIEAAIGSLKSRTQEHAAWQGRPLHWTSSDVEAARRQANAGAPLLRGPTPAETWALRTAISPAERLQFQVTVDRHRYQVRTHERIDATKDLNHWESSAVDRKAIQHALVEHDYLLFRRRRIPLEIRGQYVTNI